ncbi:Eco57I restriction-modification methylase domain-containing protein [Candidatus Poriferisodalis sp.]|uniref:Eco57I restriction-modification methylase domain-containing protein n=1 Tax=Candidatus Poriferisodalis sp. TaxID=3101277 RepID=UPI003B0144F3
MAKLDPHIAAHLEWLGFVRPIGLVVSAPALVRAGVILNRRDTEGQRLLRTCVPDEADAESLAESGPRLADFKTFAETVLDWSFSPKGYAGTPEAPMPADLLVELPETGHVLGPDFAVRAEALKTAPAAASAPDSDDGIPAMTPRSDAAGASASKDEPSPWQLLVTVIDPRESFDATSADGSGLSAHGRIERLLRHTRTPVGLVFNGVALRLVSAPAGESSGWLDFRVTDMLQTAGRPICSAMRELLSETRLLAVPADKRLAALLRESRKFQNEVSERLAEQVLHALYELLRGFQAAHDSTRGELLHHELRDEPDEIYRGLLTVVLRLVFLLYAEERDMLPQDEMFLGAYSVSGLYERLREDAALHPDTMDQRFGAYAQLLALWRMVHDGAEGPNMHLAPRHGDLFHPDSYPFLEGRGGAHGNARQTHERVDSPLVPDGTIHRVLEKLIVLDAERISYRALDVEHIGSVYETMMGFRLETAGGRSAAIKAAKRHGAPATINLEELLTEAPAQRAKWLRDRTDRKITAGVNKSVKQIDPQSGGTVSDLHAALVSVIDKNATPDLIPAGAMVLQPSEERRRSGSHYTPRELTEPIVRVALEPIFNRLQDETGGPLSPEQVLDLKVCDPAMGSGAFLVEACRQLADALIESWHAHDAVPNIPPDDDVTIYARRLVAQRCLYGVDRNPKAVDLAKLSLWLTTLAKEHPLTFLDHALRHGDSLVGLSLPQIQAFHWKGDAPNFEDGFEALRGREHLDRAAELRQQIREADDSVSERELRDLWDEAQSETAAIRLLGDLVVAAFFDKPKPRERETGRKEFANKVIDDEAGSYSQWLNVLRYSDPPLAPFHWPIEFPEVFDRENPGFDTVIGNPPFAGKNTIASSNVDNYPVWLKEANTETHGAADLVAHFFRQSFELIRIHGTFGLIATNTIAQGDTRFSGLRWICTNGGEIYNARRRFRWPGTAAVIVSFVHVHKGYITIARQLDGHFVEAINAFLFQGNRHEDPPRLSANSGMSFQGSIVLGMGFTFDDSDGDGVASPLATMQRLIEADPRNGDIIQPYIGGEEVNSDPMHGFHRYVINFRDFPLARVDGQRSQHASDIDRVRIEPAERTVAADYAKPVAADWPDLLAIVEAKVKGTRGSHSTAKWWHFERLRPDLYASIADLDRVLVNAQTSQHLQFAFLSSEMVYSHALNVYQLAMYAAFCALQTRPHEVWVRFFGSTLGDGLRYTVSDCFETFPFPENWQNLASLEQAGQLYYEARAELMVRNDEGMTKTYNRFHDPYEDASDVAELRRLHAAMDRAVLDAYGWTDIPTDCEFLLDYEIDEETWGNKRKPYRYRWPDDIRDEVLARLLELNGERAAEEARAGLAEAKRPASPRRPSPRRRPVPSVQSPASGTLWGTAASADSADLG